MQKFFIKQCIVVFAVIAGGRVSAMDIGSEINAMAQDFSQKLALLDKQQCLTLDTDDIADIEKIADCLGDCKDKVFTSLLQCKNPLSTAFNCGLHTALIDLADQVVKYLTYYRSSDRGNIVVWGGQKYRYEELGGICEESFERAIMIVQKEVDGLASIAQLCVAKHADTEQQAALIKKKLLTARRLIQQLKIQKLQSEGLELKLKILRIRAALFLDLIKMIKDK